MRMGSAYLLLASRRLGAQKQVALLSVDDESDMVIQGMVDLPRPAERECTAGDSCAARKQCNGESADW